MLKWIRGEFLFKLFFITAFFYPLFSYSEDTNSRGLLPVKRDPQIVHGRYYLLSIGIDNYLNLPKLNTAVEDAKEVTRVLIGGYGFDKDSVSELYDARATLKNIVKALRDIAEEIKPEDSLLIYYAGHGTLDDITKQGAWLPVDASPDDPTTWLENSTIKKYLSLDAIRARHILLISDSCFAGDFFREGGGRPKDITDAFVRTAFLKTSREAITSGGVEPVEDTGFSNHSVFSHFLLKALKENEETYLLPQSIYERIKGGVSQNAVQQTQYGVLHGTGGEAGGSFVFFKRKGGGAEVIDKIVGDKSMQIIQPKEKKDTDKLKTEGLKERPGILTVDMVFVKGGCFDRGDTFGGGDADEKPVHKVCVDDFYIGRFEVTQGEWKIIMGNNPSHFAGCGDDCPVESISWNDTQRFIDTFNQATGEAYRLPTEAEWEYSSWSVGKKEKWAGTNSESFLGEYAWYDSNSAYKTHPVGQKEPNGLGIYDMSGNVWELVNDWYGERFYKESFRDNPQGESEGKFKIMRGGSWKHKPSFLRSSARGKIMPANRLDSVGFRLALSFK